MEFIRRLGIAPRLLLSGLVFGMMGGPAWSQTPPGSAPAPPPAQAPPPLDGPRTEAEALPAARDASAGQDGERGAARDAEVPDVTSPPGTPARVYVTQEPPAAIAERRSGDRPDPKAVWTSGYWEWDPDGARFVWVAGTWRIPPAGMVWQPGRWIHDARGWYSVPGSWVRRAARGAIAADRPAWRISGPPAEHPDDTPPPAPGPDYFYVPGHYQPTAAGNGLAWVPGFWAAVQPGWEWIPSRWVRRPDGWDYRAGRWIRDPDTVVVNRAPRGAARRARRDANVVVRARDPITGAEVDVEADAEPAPAGPRYYVLRPPGYPYGPDGVVVPGAVPPFVRRMLDRVLP
jgi:WXXGXW repeat (2 copies)